MVGREAIPGLTYEQQRGQRTYTRPVLPSDHYGVVAEFERKGCGGCSGGLVAKKNAGHSLGKGEKDSSGSNLAVAAGRRQATEGERKKKEHVSIRSFFAAGAVKAEGERPKGEISKVGEGQQEEEMCASECAKGAVSGCSDDARVSGGADGDARAKAAEAAIRRFALSQESGSSSL